MTTPPDHEPLWVDNAIARLLRGGVLLSIAVVLFGLTFSFIHHPQYVYSKADLGHLTAPGTVYPHTVGDVFAQIREGHGLAFVMLGLLLLIVTPVARVAFSVVAFAIEGDRLYVAITLLVLVLLVASFFLGAAG